MYSQGEGEAAVRLARWAIEDHLRDENIPRPQVPDGLSRKAGAFVTVNTYPEEELRGCIGYYDAVLPLEKAVVQAAISACHDPRFPPLALEELSRVVTEVSLLTVPEILRAARPTDYPAVVLVGRDGLIVKHGRSAGLLLPQVPVEWGWDSTEFISQACLKAGLLPDSWFEPGTEIYTFQAQVFREVSPAGPVARRELSAVHDGHRG